VTTTRIALAAVAAVLVALLAGYLWGAAGRRAAERDLEAATLRTSLLECRSALLTARLDVYSVNFGDASRHLQDALDRLRPLSARLKAAGRADDAARIDRAVAQADEAQQLAGKLDQTANARAADAAAAIQEILQGGTSR
jgi:hypothetical protein